MFDMAMETLSEGYRAALADRELQLGTEWFWRHG